MPIRLSGDGEDETRVRADRPAELRSADVGASPGPSTSRNDTRNTGWLADRTTSLRLVVSQWRALVWSKAIPIAVVVTALVFLSAGQEILQLGTSPAQATVASRSLIIVGASRCADGTWETSVSGVVRSVGGCPLFGDLSGDTHHHPIVGMASTPDGGGYWLVASDGGVFAFGDAPFYGSTGSLRLNKPIVGMASTPNGKGYWLVASDGGIFAFGDAPFYGSTGSLHLNRPIVGMASTADGGGYWLVASDGGVFALGDAPFYGSTGSLRLNGPIVGMATTSNGAGYWLAAADGGVFAFGDAPFEGSDAATPDYQASTILTDTTGYEIVSTGGSGNQFGPSTTTTTTTTTSSTTTSSTKAPSTTTSTSTTPGSTLPPRPVGDIAPIPRVIGSALETSTGQPLRLLGFDADGTDNACLLNLGFSWGKDDSTEAAEIAAWHVNAVRVPINEDCWLGINGVPTRYSGQAYQSAIEQWVTTLNAAGLVAIIDLHLAAPSTYEATAQWPMADEDHAPTVWQQIAKDFAADPSVIFDLFNEPFLGQGNPTTADWQCWEDGCSTVFNTCITNSALPCQEIQYQTAGMQQLVDTVRTAGATQPVMLGGLNFGTDLCSPIAGQPIDAPCAWSLYKPTDPDNQLIASFHVYNWTACSNLACWNAQIAPMTSIAPVVTGEFGESDCSAQFMDQYMTWADSHNVSYLAWAWEAPNQSDPLSCTPSPNGHNLDVNLKLLSNWNGTPSTLNPQGPAFATHLASLAGG